MKCNLSIDELCQYTLTLLVNFFPDNRKINDIDRVIKRALEMLYYCISKNKIFRKKLSDDVFFDYLHSDQFLIFLYMCSRVAAEINADYELATKFYYLNKIRHGFDCYFQTVLPEVFYVAHGVGTVLGKATYGNYLYVCKGVTVGASRGGDYPVLGNYVSLGSECTVLGSSHLHDRSTVGAGTTIFNVNLESNCAIIRSKNGQILKLHQENPLAEYVFY